MIPETTMDKLNRLAKWRKFFASWQLGSKPLSAPGSRAVTDQYEKLILLRAEGSALVGLLIAKGVFTAEEWEAALGVEADKLSEDYAQTFPGWRATDIGMQMDMPAARETMDRLGFPQ